jgi:predicted lipoprotein with Yx(FWY)xxD motif
MPRLLQTSDPIPHPVRVPVLVLAIALALAALLGVPAANAAQASKTVAKKADDSALGKTILTSTNGRTLYSLSAEKNGKFICTTAGCRASWRPLVVPDGVKPKGPVTLGTRMRPDGRIQVTYKGLPLYTFNGDVKPGEANGEGLKDVGTWHAAAVAKLNSPQPQPEPSPYPPETRRAAGPKARADRRPRRAPGPRTAHAALRPRRADA